MAKTKQEISLPDVVGDGYGSFWRDKHRYRVVKGGRASKKSKTAALWFIYNVMKYKGANALVVRQVYNTHKDSTFADLKGNGWLKRAFKENPLECVYKPTGQKIFSVLTPVDQLQLVGWGGLRKRLSKKEDEFRVLDETIRGEMPNGLWKQLTLTFNPWVNSHWTKDRFF